MENTETNALRQYIDDLDHVMKTRLEKLEKIKELGIDPFPYKYERTLSVAGAHADFEELSKHETALKLSGRIMSMRVMGKASFAHIQEEGVKIQVYFKKNVIGEELWELFKLLDIGDIIGAEGVLFTTKTGEKTLRVDKFELLSKNIRPLPAVKEKFGKTWFKWDDKEERYRNRTLDLILNSDSRETLVKRSRIIHEIRYYLDNSGFIEVTTPILQPLYGGAAAKPFKTYYNSLDNDFYLRIADELYLKRLIAGDIPRVYEIGSDFRNEGIDRLHSPEFTMLEFYVAYEDYNFCADFFEKLMVHLVDTVLGNRIVKFGDHEIDLNPPFKRLSMDKLIKEGCGINIVNRNRDELANEIEALGIETHKSWGVGKLIDELFSEKFEPDLIQPTFIMDYPIELSPLAKKHRSKPGLVERFELFVGGYEIANAFSELNDPLDQKARFEEQVRLRDTGDEEAHPIDEDYIRSLEIGMPPTAGLGTGIDRLVMILTNESAIRDVIPFPTLRPKN